MNPAHYRAFPPRARELPFRDAADAAAALTRWVDVALQDYIRARIEQSPNIPAPDELAERGGRALLAMEAGPAADADHIRCYNHILDRLRHGGPAREAAFLRLCARMDMEALDLFCLAAAVLCGASAHYADLFALARGVASPAFSDAAQVYFGAPVLDSAQLAKLSQAAHRVAPLLPADARGGGALALTADDRMIRLFFGLDDLDGGENSRNQGISLITPSDMPDALPLHDAALAAMRGGGPVIELTGDAGSGRHTLLCRWAALENRAVVCLDGNRLTGPDPDAAIRRARRECLIADAALCVTNPAREALLPRVAALTCASRGPLFLRSGERALLPEDGVASVCLALELPDTAARYRLWRHHLQNSPLLESIDIWSLANRYPETPGRIAKVCTRLRAVGPDASFADAQRLLKEEASFADSRLAAAAETPFSWDDLILKSESKNTLLQACGQMRDRHTVHEKWGFADRLPYGKGLALLFYGPPGTGKTMAAHIAAKELGLPLLRVDLSQVVDKYVGETEKNIARIFDRAQKSNVILFFDEADALFGKRGEVKNANDRSANLEVGYLLQRIETYEGMSILATNLLDEIDPAFLRRIRFVIDFPFPDAKARLAIWASVFPKQTPLDPDIDFAFLAEKFEFSGGNIKNAALNAAFLAAADGRDAVSMQDVIRCVRRELVKNGSVFYAASLGPYAHLV